MPAGGAAPAPPVVEQSLDSYGRPSRLLATVVPILMLVAPFLGMVRDVGHGVWRTDTLTCLGMLGAGGIVCGLLIQRRGRIAVVVLAALLTLTVDLLLKGRTFSRSLLWLRPDPSLAVEPIAGAVLFLIALLVCWLLQRHLLPILGAGFAVTLATTLLMPTGTAVAARDIRGTQRAVAGQGPLVIHLILDEHVGLAGVPDDVPGAARLRQTLVSFYEEFGFRLYDRSYSIYTETPDSLPNLVNFSTSAEPDAFVDRHGSADNPSYAVTDNAYFHRLARLGYRIRVYQSTFMDFCRNPSIVSDCYVYPVWGFDAAREAIPLGGRIRLLMSVYVRDSLVYYTAKHTLYERLRRAFPGLMPWTWERGRTTPLTTMAALARLRKDLTDASPGTAYVAHLLLPHAPYAYDSACGIRHPATWRNSGDDLNTADSRRERYSQYFDQTLCLYSQLRTLFEQLRDSGRLDDAVVLMHGDHGSRIAGRHPASWREEYQDVHSTLFAVKAPGIAPGVDHSHRSVSQLFEELWTGRRDADHKPFVFVPGEAPQRRLERRDLAHVKTDPGRPD